MTHDMKTALTRLFTVIMLMMFSMGASADVKVLYGEKGAEKFEGTGGTIEVKQEDSKNDKTKVTITLIVTPADGYKMEKNGIEAYAVISPDGASTRAPEISGDALNLTCNDYTADTKKRTYTVDIDSKLALWVKKVDFTNGGESKWTSSTHPYAGIWYMTNSTNSMAGYVVPAANPQITTAGHVYEDAYFSSDYSSQDGNPEMPFLTTYPTSGDLNSIWVLVPVDGENNYYYIVHAKTGKYLKYQTYLSGNDARRKYVHLETLTTPGETEKFEITAYDTGVKIKPKNNAMYFNIAGNNQNAYHGSTGNKSPYYSGIIGGMSGNNDGSKFILGDASSATTLTPVISDVNAATNTFSITSPAAAFSSFRYTTDGTTTPTASVGSETNGTSVLLTGTWNVQAVGVFESFVTPVAGPKELVPVALPPTITYNNATAQATITCTSALHIYYNTGDGTQADPTPSSVEYSNPISVTTPTTIKAIAVYAGDNASAVVTLSITQVATPTIQNNGSNAISITTTTPGATIYYTTDGSTPNTSSTQYTAPLTDNVSNVTIKAIAVKENMINSAVGSGSVKLQCAKPIITRNGMTITISCSMPTDATFYYSLDGNTPTTSYSGPVSFTTDELPMTVTAVAKHANYKDSEYATFELLNGAGTSSDPYLIYGATDFTKFISNVNAGTTSSAFYKLETDIDASGTDAITTAFSGTFDGDFHTISNLGHALFNTIDGGMVKNVILDEVGINSGTNVGAIANEVIGTSSHIACIYNCGILSGSVSGSGNVGGLVGQLGQGSPASTDAEKANCYARVINCYSYANITNGSSTGGVVGYNGFSSTSDNIRTMVMNCMFYGDITGGSNISPVYGGELIDNAGETGINNYNYYRRNSYDRENDTYVDDVTFDNNFSLDDYHRSWPADAKYLTRFEYYRSILNSNKKLCTWWVKGTNGTAPTDDDIKEVGIAKWVLDPSIAPYPILKKWGKYSSVINQDPKKRFNPSTKAWETRGDASDHWGKDMAPDTEGQELGTVTVTINDGRSPGSSITPADGFIITAMDKENHDYCYGKIQLPYYNEIFGNPNGATWEAKYGGNYTDKVVTGWDISGGSTATNYNFAERSSYSGRVFAQGGYFYVPKGVTSITITAHWADAVYLCNKDRSIDRVNVAAGEKKSNANRAVPEYGSSFNPAGTLPETFQGKTVYTTVQEAIGALNTSGNGKDVYNQAIVLIGNVQVRNHSYVVNLTGSNTKPFTLMSADLDFDNEPDYCMELQFRNDIDRPGIQPIRFDFLPVPELGLAIRTNKLAYAIGIMIPLGHFEITETAFMHTTQFEYDANFTRTGKSPVIINGGEHEMFTVRKHASDRTSYFLLGGNAWIHRFAPGAHPNTGDSPNIYLCPINVIGGEIKELYLSGLYRPALSAPANQGDPTCYIDGGKFDIVAGAGYDKVAGGVTFKIDHSLIDEFYGGGINGTNPIGGNIDVTINNSRVDKYCGGPKVGNMTGKTVTTHAKGTTFGVFYGGGNGGNSYYRQLQRDGDMASSHIRTWTDEDYNWDGFTPLQTSYDDGSQDATGYNEKQNITRKVYNKGYHAEYEFEVFNQSNGLSDEITQRGFIHWIQFGITSTGDVSNTLENCKVLQNFYGGGNLATVDGTVTSKLINTIVDGNVFGAGYSADIPTFQVHKKVIGSYTFPSIDDAGVITDGHIDHDDKVYEWINDIADNAVGTTDEEKKEWMKKNPTYKKGDQWYCYTWNSLKDLGVVKNTVKLSLDGDSKVGTMVQTVNPEISQTESSLKSGTGNVYGGGDASDVEGSTTVTLAGNTEVYGNVFGGGNNGEVSGSATVNILQTLPTE